MEYQVKINSLALRDISVGRGLVAQPQTAPLWLAMLATSPAGETPAGRFDNINYKGEARYALPVYGIYRKCSGGSKPPPYDGIYDLTGAIILLGQRFKILRRLCRL